MKIYGSNGDMYDQISEMATLTYDKDKLKLHLKIDLTFLTSKEETNLDRNVIYDVRALLKDDKYKEEVNEIISTSISEITSELNNSKFINKISVNLPTDKADLTVTDSDISIDLHIDLYTNAITKYEFEELIEDISYLNYYEVVEYFEVYINEI